MGDCHVFLPLLQRGITFAALFASLDCLALPRSHRLLKERICSYQSKFFPFKVDATEKGGKHVKANCFPESVPIQLYKNGYTFTVSNSVIYMSASTIPSCKTVFVQVLMEIHNFCGQHKIIILKIQIYVLTNIMFFKRITEKQNKPGNLSTYKLQNHKIHSQQT